MQLRRSILIAICIILFIYFEIHSCSKDEVVAPPPIEQEVSSIICDASDVFFINEKVGWVAGTFGTLMKTMDGGNTWVGVKIDDSRFSDVDFTAADRGWAVGKDGAFYKTNDGGESWERVISSGFPPDEDFSRVVFFNDTLGYVLGYKGVYRTADGGDSWVNNWLPVVPYRGAWGMSFVNGRVGFLLGSRWLDDDPVMIYKTLDGAKTWHPVEGSRTSILRTIGTIYFIDENTGWAGGGVIMKTEDGGMTWRTQLEPAVVREFYFVNCMYGFAVGGDKILKTTDGGSTWTDVTPDDDRIVDLRSVQFFDESSGWVTGRGKEERINGKTYKHSILLKTTDGGESWSIKDFVFDYTAAVESQIQ